MQQPSRLLSRLQTQLTGHSATEPLPSLVRRIGEDLATDFCDDRPIRLSRAPGQLDVMGGVAEFTGSQVCRLPIDRAAAIAIQERDDRQVQIFSFNQYDQHLPFTLRIPLEALAQSNAESLRRDLAEPGRQWAAHVIGFLANLYDKKLVDLLNERIRGISVAILSNVPSGQGLRSKDAIKNAAQAILTGHFGIGNAMYKDRPLTVPSGVKFIGIDSRVRDPNVAERNRELQCAAIMGHQIILEKMREMGRAAGRTLDGDPMRGQLTNLDPADYKKYFRPYLPASIRGREFLAQLTSTNEQIVPDKEYFVLGAVDHHVLEAGRVMNFVNFIEEADALGPFESLNYEQAVRRGSLLDKAGHLMYASHLSYTNDARLGADECDWLVNLVREREPAGLYGARITDRGCGGTVAVLANETSRVDEAIAEILREYEKLSGRKPELFNAASAGDSESLVI